MKRSISLAALAGASAGLIATCIVTAALSGPAAAAGQARPAVAHRAAHTCAAPRRGYYACAAIVRLTASGKPAAGTAPAGLGPHDIASAYKLRGSSRRTVAIIDAYHDPTAAADLAKYRATFGLPACTKSSGCLTQVSQTGSTTVLPATDSGWATEISLDLDMVSAACPTCPILLVEASTASAGNLATAVSYAARQHVAAISNSYGGQDTGQSSAYNHPGIAVVASTGDSGYGVEAPASFGSVVAVGGTSLTKSRNARGWSESAWSGAGSGCSTRNAKPAWQTAATSCHGKATADVSAVADPYTGVAVYDSTPYEGAAGWQVYGGTSASAPIIAGVYALSGHTAGYPASLAWAHAGKLFDVTSGSNGSCRPAVLCTAGRGWDGPTGLGTPNGTTAF